MTKSGIASDEVESIKKRKKWKFKNKIKFYNKKINSELNSILAMTKEKQNKELVYLKIYQ